VKRFCALIVAILGGAICLWAASSLLLTGNEIVIDGKSYHAMFPGLVGVGLLTVGLLFRYE
jgi:hypothetical protein